MPWGLGLLASPRSSLSLSLSSLKQVLGPLLCQQ